MLKTKWLLLIKDIFDIWLSFIFNFYIIIFYWSNNKNLLKIQLIILINTVLKLFYIVIFIIFINKYKNS